MPGVLGNSRIDELERLLEEETGITQLSDDILRLSEKQKVKISVVGFGNAGVNMAKNLAISGKLDADIYIFDTDVGHLMKAVQLWKIAKERGYDVTPMQYYPIGKRITQGKGSGMKPWLTYEIIMRPGSEERKIFEDIAKKSDLIIVLTGLGGGTGTGASIAFTKIARSVKKQEESPFMSQKDPLTVNQEPLIITIAALPFSIEKQGKRKIALMGLSELFKYSHSVIVIENDSIKDIFHKHDIREAFKKSDLVTAHVASAIIRMLNSQLEYNVDFADLYRLMYDAKMSYIGIGASNSSTMAVDAIKEALSQPLITKSMILDKQKAHGAIVFFEVPPGEKTGRHFAIDEFYEAVSIVSNLVDDSGMLKWSIDFDVPSTCEMEDGKEVCKMRALVIVAGVESKYIEYANEAAKEFGSFEKFVQLHVKRTEDKNKITFSKLFEEL